MSLAMLLLNIYLFNNLAEAEYGYFVQLYSLALLIQTIFLSFSLEPSLVGGEDLNNLHHFRKLWSAWLWLFAGVLLLYFAGHQIFGADTLTGVLFLFYTSGTCFLFFQRKATNVGSGQLKAFWGSLLYVALLGALLIAFQRGVEPSLNASLLSMAVASLVVLVLVYRIWPEKISIAYLKKLGSAHGAMTLAMIATAVFQWVPNNFIFFILPLYSDPGSAGEAKALLNLILPLMHFNMVLGSFMPPRRRAGMLGKQRFSYLPYIAISFFVHATYILALSLYAEPVVGLVYSRDLPISNLEIALLCLVPSVTAALCFVHTEIRATLSHRIFVQGYVAMLVICLPLTFYLVDRFGLQGALGSISLMFLVLLIAQLTLLVHSGGARTTEASL
ncbi:hypothetical protein [Parahaliea mediterranea]|uniref:hypothetical protein n=1 Tax=Parahaliea mediterranea TaxID=651086 RepID=UPI00130051A2|nr:hypothetical protein [Parahaliea mediterranea]